MTAVWLAVPTVLLVGTPFVARALGRAARDATATLHSLRAFSSEVAAAADGLRDASGAFSSSLRAFTDDLGR